MSELKKISMRRGQFNHVIELYAGDSITGQHVIYHFRVSDDRNMAKHKTTSVCSE